MDHDSKFSYKQCTNEGFTCFILEIVHSGWYMYPRIEHGLLFNYLRVLNPQSDALITTKRPYIFCYFDPFSVKGGLFWCVWKYEYSFLPNAMQSVTFVYYMPEFQTICKTAVFVNVNCLLNIKSLSFRKEAAVLI